MNKQGGIMNAELIKALREDAEWAHANEWETPITLGDHLDAAADALEAADNRVKELEEAQRWIAVSERLPEVGKCVLVRQTYSPFRNGHGEFEEVTVGYLHQPTDNRRKPYFYWVAVSDYGDMVRAESICPGSKYVTHWQPLPDPPQKGE